MRSSPVPARLAGLFLGLGMVAAAGCGPSFAKVTGKVTYQGNPLKGGTVTFIPVGEGKTFSTLIQEDGTYTMDHVETGKYKVCVETTSVKPDPSNPTGSTMVDPRIKNVPPPGAKLPEGYVLANPGGAAERAKRYVPIPPQYGDPQKTTLTVEVKGGSFPHDIPLS
jgi:hypothetical protein